MRLYHSTNNELDYIDAQILAAKYAGVVEQAGGSISAPQAPVQTPARLVLELPEGVSPEQVMPGIGFNAVEMQE